MECRSLDRRLLLAGVEGLVHAARGRRRPVLGGVDLAVRVLLDHGAARTGWGGTDVVCAGEEGWSVSEGAIKLRERASQPKRHTSADESRCAMRATASDARAVQR